MGVETVKSFNHYSERIQLSTESRKLPANINDKDRQQQQSPTSKTEPHQHLLKRLPTSSRGIKSRASVEAIDETFDWLLNHVEHSLHIQGSLLLIQRRGCLPFKYSNFQQIYKKLNQFYKKNSGLIRSAQTQPYPRAKSQNDI